MGWEMPPDSDGGVWTLLTIQFIPLQVVARFAVTCAERDKADGIVIGARNHAACVFGSKMVLHPRDKRPAEATGKRPKAPENAVPTPPPKTYSQTPPSRRTSSAPGEYGAGAMLSVNRTEMAMPSNAAQAPQPPSIHRGVKRELDAADDDCAGLRRPLKQKPAPTASSDSVDAEASEFIKVELNRSDDALRYRRSILEAALGFVNRVSHRANDAAAVDETACAIKVMSASASANKYQFPDQILPKTLKRMAIALVDGTVGGQALAEYRVCVCFKTYILFSMWPALEDSDVLLKEHIKSSRNRYRDLTLQSLSSMSMMAQPTIGLCQALVAGCVFAHLTGDTSRSWNLVAYASRVLVALGYHKAENSASAPETDEDYEIQGCVFWCFIMDRLLSMHLGRPPSLPGLELNRAWLAHPDLSPPLTAIADLLADFACIQDMVLSWRDAHRRKGSSDGTEAGPSIASIQYRMTDISAKINNARKILPEGIRDMLFSLDFAYFSLDTIVLRLSPYVASDPDTRQRCLTSARDALFALSALQDQELRRSNGAAEEEYPSFLAWTIHAYPLCPFFVVFCNVVSTSSVQDFQLIQKVTDVFARYAAGNKAVKRLHELCSKLVELCRPPFQLPSSVPEATTTYLPYGPQASGVTVDVRANMIFTPDHALLGNAALPQQHYSLATSAGNSSSVPRTATSFAEFAMDTSLWTDNTMMGLFNYEPSLSWLNG
ncbi:hypothetical protein AK830_g5942 [Neonectria ditissima]|uniref:Xylanolytic transcriptional activator regulatory domain-containing protein n=1 Tax=Neonectria ditissima TaxID=78410 RepID=A0A0P7B3J8_9HYPO|nr:hypothetical protein AK830_g5942 [Neonectria ditissima]